MFRTMAPACYADGRGLSGTAPRASLTQRARKVEASQDRRPLITQFIAGLSAGLINALVTQYLLDARVGSGRDRDTEAMISYPGSGD
jgi:hypothetical protein